MTGPDALRRRRQQFPAEFFTPQAPTPPHRRKVRPILLPPSPLHLPRKLLAPGRIVPAYPLLPQQPVHPQPAGTPPGREQIRRITAPAKTFQPRFRRVLRRLAEMGGGKILDPETDSPFLHDRQKTFQPQDLRDWLLKFAILLFPLDVAVRRIQLDRDQWLKAVRTFQRWLFFWKGVPRTREADESLAALLTRRSQVRAQQPQPAPPPSPDLFRPEKPAPISEVPGQAGERTAAPGQAPLEDGKKPAAEPVSTASRLLEARRRAQKRGKIDK